MTREKFILVSLKDDDSKLLAQIISNNTSRKILDYLAEKDATESEIAEELKVPISTIHYNLQALLKAKLVESEEFHYSEKGKKEVNHYKLASKYIIIAPKSTHGIKEKLKSILPVGLIALGAAFILEFIQKFTKPELFTGSVRPVADIASEKLVQDAAVGGVMQAAVESEVPSFATRAFSDNASMTVEKAVAPVRDVVSGNMFGLIQSETYWFLAGVLFVILVYIIFIIANKKRGYMRYYMVVLMVILFLFIVGCSISSEQNNDIVKTPTGCNSDSDCGVGGCSGQVCGTIDTVKDIVTTCEYRAEYGCFKFTSCSCIDGNCQWSETLEYLDCLETVPDEGPIKIIS